MTTKKKSDPQNTSDQNPSPVYTFPIVGIGASAGGLAAFEAFFSGMPTDVEPGMAFILVQHLAPDHESILTELIKRCTRMQVYEVKDGMQVLPNCAYIIPPNHDMALLNGTLQLLEPAAPRGLRLPIDFFFRSLAADQHERAVCIVLTGTGSDGSLGVRAVKGEGGLVIAQDPDTTEYNSMPLNAIATGSVDFILPPLKMAAQLIACAAHTNIPAFQSTPPSLGREEDRNKKIFVLLRAKTGHDFSGYKPQTIIRRVQRRMTVNQVEHLADYVHYLQQTPTEVEMLFHDLLIGVTSFFRDPFVFEALEKLVLQQIITSKSPNDTIRVWVAGCSTGEEAFSLAILFQEALDTLKQTRKIQIFATDIDTQAIERARSGIFPANIAVDISPERLTRYFDLQSGGGYRIHKSIRDLLVFSEHDLIKDPPFSRLDLVSCRNVLIYMGQDLHKKLIPLFHYALNPGGSLLLGTSESIGDSINLFSTLDRKSKIYQRITSKAAWGNKEAIIQNMSSIEKFTYQSKEFPSISRQRSVPSSAIPLSLRDLTEQMMLHLFTPTALLVNEQGEILFQHGRSGRYLELAPGEPASMSNILKLSREGLRPALTTALHKAASHREKVVRTGLLVKTNGDFSTVNLTVIPASNLNPKAFQSIGTAPIPDNLFLVILEDAPAPPPPSTNFPGKNPQNDQEELDARIMALKQEVRDKDEFIQNSNEQLETTFEELKSSNEEMQSVNEELQSTNEELETAKEELQSVNEELSTVNSELQQKVMDLSRTNDDMNNLLTSTGVGTIFVNHKFIIQRFTPFITPIINLIASDIGRSLADIASNLEDYDHLLTDIRSVLDTLIPIDIEVKIHTGSWYLMRIQPYRTSLNVIEGVVISFTEITELKKAQAARHESEGMQRLATVVRDANDAILVQDLAGRILSWNPAAERMYGWSEIQALTMNIRELVPEEDRKQALSLVQQMCRGRILEPYLLSRITLSGKKVNVYVTATALVTAEGDTYAIATTERIAAAED